MARAQEAPDVSQTFTPLAEQRGDMHAYAAGRKLVDERNHISRLRREAADHGASDQPSAPGSAEEDETGYGKTPATRLHAQIERDKKSRVQNVRYALAQLDVVVPVRGRDAAGTVHDEKNGGGQNPPVRHLSARDAAMEYMGLSATTSDRQKAASADGGEHSGAATGEWKMGSTRVDALVDEIRARSCHPGIISTYASVFALVESGSLNVLPEIKARMRASSAPSNDAEVIGVMGVARVRPLGGAIDCPTLPVIVCESGLVFMLVGDAARYLGDTYLCVRSRMRMFSANMFSETSNREQDALIARCNVLDGDVAHRLIAALLDVDERVAMLGNNSVRVGGSRVLVGLHVLRDVAEMSRLAEDGTRDSGGNDVTSGREPD